MTVVELSKAYFYRQRAKKEKLVHLADVNFSDTESSFVTLTFANNVTEYEPVVKAFKLFCKRLRRKFENIKYIATVETQKRGALHLHILLNVPCKGENIDAIKSCWEEGMIDIQEVLSIKGRVLYMCKDFTVQDRSHVLFDKRCYFVSQGLEQCIQVNSWNDSLSAIAGVQALEKSEALIKAKTVETEHAGLVEYKEYCITTDYYGELVVAKLK